MDNISTDLWLSMFRMRIDFSSLTCRTIVNNYLLLHHTLFILSRHFQALPGLHGQDCNLGHNCMTTGKLYEAKQSAFRTVAKT